MGHAIFSKISIFHQRPLFYKGDFLMKALAILMTSWLIFLGSVAAMDISQMNETDLFGRFFLKAPNAGKFSNYYTSLDAIRPLIRGEQWAQYVKGYWW